MWYILHKAETDKNACGYPICIMTKDLKPGEVMDASTFTNLDGTPVKDGDPILCGSCGNHVTVANFNFNNRVDKEIYDLLGEESVRSAV